MKGAAVGLHFINLSVPNSFQITLPIYNGTGGKRPIERLRRRWKDNIKIDLQKVCWEHRLYWCVSGYEKLAGCCESGTEPSGSIKCGKFLDLLRTC
jgi:hypothetical protein